MPTTVRVEDRVKSDLDQLQRHVEAETGERLSHSDLLARLLRFARRNEARFLGGGGAEWRGPTREQMEEFFRRLPRTGIKTDVTRIDEELYG